MLFKKKGFEMLGCRKLIKHFGKRQKTRANRQLEALLAQREPGGEAERGETAAARDGCGRRARRDSGGPGMAVTVSSEVQHQGHPANRVFRLKGKSGRL